MVVITMREQDKVWIGDDIEIVFIKQKGRREIRVGFRAPKELKISRDPVNKRNNLNDEQLQHQNYQDEE